MEKSDISTTTKAEKVLLVGATGFLGSKIAQKAAEKGKTLRALVREGSNASALEALGIEIVRGDISSEEDVSRAMTGCGSVISSAAGYTSRRKGDFASGTDTIGQRTLARVARKTGVRRYILCSVLTCDKAEEVPHFWHKKLAEDALRTAGVPYISLRPGAFLDQGPQEFWLKGLEKGKLSFLSDPTIPATFVHPDDVADCLVAALDIETEETALTIDLGASRPVSINDLAQIMSAHLGREIKASVPPQPLVSVALSLVGLFKPAVKDLATMMRYFRKGTYVADTRKQTQYFGEPARIEEAVARYLDENRVRHG